MKKLFFSLFFLYLGFFVNGQDDVQKINDLKIQSTQTPPGIEQLEILNKSLFLHYNRLNHGDTIARKVISLSDSLGEFEIKNQALLKLTEYCNWRGIYHVTDSIVAQIIPYFTSTGDSLSIGKALIQSAVSNRRQLKSEEGRKNLERAINILSFSNDIGSYSQAIYHYSSYWSSVDKNEKALKYAHKAYLLSERLKNRSYFGFANLKLSHLTEKNRLHYMETALKAANEANDCILKGLVYFTYLGYYNNKKEYDKSLNTIEKIEQNSYCQGRPEANADGVFANRKGILYFKKKEYSKAKKYLLEDYQYLNAQVYTAYQDSSISKIPLKHLKNYPRSTLPLAEVSFNTQNFTAAKKWGFLTIKIAKRLNDPETIARASYIVSDACAAQGLYQKSLKYFVKATEMRDSILARENRKDLKNIETKFEVNRISKENIILEQEKEISKQKAFRNQIIAIVGILTMVVLVLFLWWYLRSKRIEEQHKKANIEQRFLRSQLNPHFLFNSLAAINNFVVSKRTEEAGKYLAGFSKLMRSILEHSREELITLNEEINALKSYMVLQQLRSNNKFDFEINYNDDLETEFLYVPPMVLQPVIENAIEHGFKGIKYKGLISINIKEQDNYILIKITDNGIGREQAKKNSNTVFKKKSLATTITQERLELINKGLPEKIIFEIIDLHNPTGTEVYVSIPSTLGVK